MILFICNSKSYLFNFSGGLSYIAQNIQGNMMQSHKTIIIVQGGGGGGPITLTVR